MSLADAKLLPGDHQRAITFLATHNSSYANRFPVQAVLLKPTNSNEKDRKMANNLVPFRLAQLSHLTLIISLILFSLLLPF